MNNTPLVLAILDGYGLAPPGPDNAIAAASTPVLDSLFARYPHTSLKASGLAVGLPQGQMGNSEVGHTNMGAGRVVYQDLTRISKAIADGNFFENRQLLNAIDHAVTFDGTVHLMGLCSDGGVHSHMSHIFALMRLCRERGARTVIHCFLDGRDTSPQSGADFVEQVEGEIVRLGGPLSIGTVMGRFYAMDRDRRWERLEVAYRALVMGEAPLASSPSAAVRDSYAAGVTDEFMLPVKCREDACICAQDSVIFFNFRPDRARELTRALCDPDFDGFARPGGLVASHFVCLTQYEQDMPGVTVAFDPQGLDNILGAYLSAKGLRQLRIAETEKYAHVTFFFNGGEERQFPGESRILVPSPKVQTYDLQPEMSAFEVADQCCAAILSGEHDVVILNLANCDMVGHTGVFEAAVRAVEAVDTALGRVAEAVKRAGGLLLVTADHGNADKMRENGAPFTAHTLSPVPFILCREGYCLKAGALCDIAPTLLVLLGLPQPPEMLGQSLIV